MVNACCLYSSNWNSVWKARIKDKDWKCDWSGIILMSFDHTVLNSNSDVVDAMFGQKVPSRDTLVKKAIPILSVAHIFTYICIINKFNFLHDLLLIIYDTL